MKLSAGPPALKAKVEALQRENAELKRTAEKASKKKQPDSFFKDW